MIDGEQLKRNILDDMRVELSDEFDKNFDRKAFFTKKWKRRANPNAKGSLLMVTGTMRRSIKAEVRGNGVRFTSAVPYAAIHNEGGTGTKPVRQHTRTSRKGKQYTVKAHTHTVQDHTHKIEFGIYEGARASSATIKVDGVEIPAPASYDNLDIVEYLKTDGSGKIQRNAWHTIQILPNSMSRIVGAVFMQTFCNSRGGGDY